MSNALRDGIAKEESTCPRCGFVQPRAAECARCGVLFAKARNDSPLRPLHPAAPPPRATAPAGGGGSLSGWLVVLCLGVVVAAYIFFAHGGAGRPLSSQAASAPSAQQAAARPVRMPYLWYEGASGYTQAINEARADGRPVAVYFYTDWCPDCHEFQRKILRAQEVQQHFTAVVKVRINPESGAEEYALAERYGIREYPSFFVEASGSGGRKQINHALSDRLKTPEEFVASCREAEGL